MTVIKRKFHQDGGHGWLCVKRSELEDLGIADRITSFSYQRNQSVYLEEDLDYTTYHDALSREVSNWSRWMAKYLTDLIQSEDLNTINPRQRERRHNVYSKQKRDKTIGEIRSSHSNGFGL